MPVRQECDKKLRERGKNLCVLITEIKFSCIQKPLINTPVIFFFFKNIAVVIHTL